MARVKHGPVLDAVESLFIVDKSKAYKVVLPAPPYQLLDGVDVAHNRECTPEDNHAVGNHQGIETTCCIGL